SDLFDAQALDLQLELAILLPHSAEIEVVMPDAADAGLDPHDGFFERRHGADGPHADETGGFILGRTPYLNGQPQHLNKQNDHQDGDVAIAADEVFHKTVVRPFAIGSGQAKSGPWSFAFVVYEMD